MNFDIDIYLVKSVKTTKKRQYWMKVCNLQVNFNPCSFVNTHISTLSTLESAVKYYWMQTWTTRCERTDSTLLHHEMKTRNGRKYWKRAADSIWQRWQHENVEKWHRLRSAAVVCLLRTPTEPTWINSIVAYDCDLGMFEKKCFCPAIVPALIYLGWCMKAKWA